MLCHPANFYYVIRYTTFIIFSVQVLVNKTIISHTLDMFDVIFFRSLQFIIHVRILLQEYNKLLTNLYDVIF